MDPIATPPAAWAASLFLRPRSSRLGPLLTHRPLGRVLSASLGRSALTLRRVRKRCSLLYVAHTINRWSARNASRFIGLAPSGHPYGDSKLAATGQADFLRSATKDSQYGPSLFRSLSIASGHGRKSRAGKTPPSRLLRSLIVTPPISPSHFNLPFIEHTTPPPSAPGPLGARRNPPSADRGSIA